MVGSSAVGQGITEGFLKLTGIPTRGSGGPRPAIPTATASRAEEHLRIKPGVFSSIMHFDPKAKIVNLNCTSFLRLFASESRLFSQFSVNSSTAILEPPVLHRAGLTELLQLPVSQHAGWTISS